MLTRMLARERCLWTDPIDVSQAALSERFLRFPSELFKGVLGRVLEALPARFAARTRPLPPLLAGLSERFSGLYVADGTTLEALFRKLKAHRDDPTAPLGGHLVAVFQLCTQLPVKLWVYKDPSTHDTQAIPALLQWLPKNSLLVLDRGFFGFVMKSAPSSKSHAQLPARTGSWTPPAWLIQALRSLHSHPPLLPS